MLSLKFWLCFSHTPLPPTNIKLFKKKIYSLLGVFFICVCVCAKMCLI